MKNDIHIHSIGSIYAENGEFFINVKEEYLDALTSLNGFSHLQILWWGHLTDNAEHRSHLIAKKPYKKGPNEVGVFASRSQFRPNPILITNIFVQEIDFENGIIRTPYIDAENNTPLLDIKPYHAHEKIENCGTPDWCSHWPSNYEESAHFDWQNEFNF